MLLGGVLLAASVSALHNQGLQLIITNIQLHVRMVCFVKIESLWFETNKMNVCLRPILEHNNKDSTVNGPNTMLCHSVAESSILGLIAYSQVNGG